MTMNEKPENVIEVEGLVKRFGQFTAVDTISFQVGKNEIFGLLGAGKTTTIKCLLTLIEPTSGTARISGVDIRVNPQQVRQVSGYVPQDISVDGELTGYENLLFYAKLFHVPAASRRERIREVLEFMQLADRADSLVKTYSGGMMRRLEIGQVMVNRPQAIFLDEPTVGLDPIARRVVWEHIFKLREEFNATILLTTHDMNEADELCDRIAIMDGGKIAAIGSPEELKLGLGGDIVTVATASPDFIRILERLGYHLLAQSQDGICDIVVKEGDREIPHILEELKNNGINVQSVSLKRATLDDVFLKYAGRRIHDGDADWQSTRAARRTMRRISR
jgi:ABC-2 type transport system ATP-binding protein